MLRRADIPVLAAEREQGDPLVILGGPAASANPEPLAPRWGCLCHRGGGAYPPGSHRLPARGMGSDARSHVAVPGAAAWRVRANLLRWASASSGSGCATWIAFRFRRASWRRMPNSAICTSSRYRADVAEGVVSAWPDTGIALLGSTAWKACCNRRARGWSRGAKSAWLRRLYLTYSRVEELVAELQRMGAEISVSSLRVAPLSSKLVAALATGKSRSITFAPEAGSQRLREVINKCVTHDDIMAAVRLAATHRFESLKLYFMVGLPGEERSGYRRPCAPGARRWPVSIHAVSWLM